MSKIIEFFQSVREASHGFAAVVVVVVVAAVADAGDDAVVIGVDVVVVDVNADAVFFLVSPH